MGQLGYDQTSHTKLLFLSFSNVVVKGLSFFTSSQMGQRYLLEIARKKKYLYKYAKAKQDLQHKDEDIAKKEKVIDSLQSEINRLETRGGISKRVQELKKQLAIEHEAKKAEEQARRDLEAEVDKKKAEAAEEAAEAKRLYYA